MPVEAPLADGGVAAGGVVRLLESTTVGPGVAENRGVEAVGAEQEAETRMLNAVAERRTNDREGRNNSLLSTRVPRYTREVRDVKQ